MYRCAFVEAVKGKRDIKDTLLSCPTSQSSYRHVNVACKACSMVPKVPHPRSGVGTRLFKFFLMLVEECLDSTAGAI